MKIERTAAMDSYPFPEMLLERSWEKFVSGLRTEQSSSTVWPIIHHGQALHGDFLISTYDGGAVICITTVERQWLGLAEETEFGHVFQQRHRAKPASYFSAQVYRQEKQDRKEKQEAKRVRDGQNRIRK